MLCTRAVKMKRIKPVNGLVSNLFQGFFWSGNGCFRERKLSGWFVSKGLGSLPPVFILSSGRPCRFVACRCRCSFLIRCDPSASLLCAKGFQRVFACGRAAGCCILRTRICVMVVFFKKKRIIFRRRQSVSHMWVIIASGIPKSFWTRHMKKSGCCL